MTRKYLAFAAFLCLLANPLAAQTDTSPPSEGEQQAAMTAPQDFVDRAASSNMFELMTSKLALEKSISADVRAFAENMIADHGSAAEQMKAAAAEDGVTPAEEMMPDHQEQLETLSSVEPAEFDAAYLGAQLAAHTEAVMIFEGFANQGKGGALKDFATELLPELKEHFEAVRKLSEI